MNESRLEMIRFFCFIPGRRVDCLLLFWLPLFRFKHIPSSQQMVSSGDVT